MSIAELLEGKRVVICAGAGGVGKTTTAAAIALGMAARGSKVAVVTIDPARRLASALGLGELDNQPRLIDPARLAPLELEGELWAMMLDPKRTFDELIDAVAPSAQRAQEIKGNRIYRQLSTAVAGSQEFTAIAKLHELTSTGEYDLVVLDTPPSRNALDFLDAPARLESFLEGGALKAFLRPTGMGMRVLALSTAPVLAALRRVTGIDLVADLSTFFTLLGTMTESFDRRARQVDRLLHSPTSGFLVISSPQPRPTEEAIWFRGTLVQGGLPFTGAVVNRVHPAVEPGPPAPLPPALGAKVAQAAHEYAALVARDATSIERLQRALEGAPLLLVPELSGDVHDLSGLLQIREQLFR